jgi:hypothetical protein
MTGRLQIVEVTAEHWKGMTAASCRPEQFLVLGQWIRIGDTPQAELSGLK